MAKCKADFKSCLILSFHLIYTQNLKAQQQLAYEFEQLRSIQTTLNSFKSDNHTDRPLGPIRNNAIDELNHDPDVWGSPQPRDPDVWPSPTPVEHKYFVVMLIMAFLETYELKSDILLVYRPPPPVRPRPNAKKSDLSAPKPPPSRGGKPPSGAVAASNKKPESRIGNKGPNKEEGKGSGASKSAPAKGKEPKLEENKDEKILEEEKEERRFDPSGYDKDLVEMLGSFIQIPMEF